MSQEADADRQQLFLAGHGFDIYHLTFISAINFLRKGYNCYQH